MGWKVYIWTYRQLVNDREKIKAELVQFLGNNPNFRTHDDYLPFQKGRVLELKKHQQETLDNLAKLREENFSMALVADAQGTGKTTTAVLDAKRMGLRTLFVAHTLELLDQAERRFCELWPGVKVLKINDFQNPIDGDVLIASIQGVYLNLDKFSSDEFNYIIIDEAHRLDLKTAIEIGELVPIRCVKVKTNIDFHSVRFNGIKYNYRDLDEKMHLPERNRLIVDTYLDHVPGRKAVVFCASIKHAREVAGLFRSEGVAARAVDGGMKKSEREGVLEAYRRNEIQVLCACDMLNEGWDSPETSVLFMVRPTLSKVIYLQQLGRGTRKARGKDALLVFDFIDNTSRYNHAVNLHRLLKQKNYIPGGFVLALPSQIAEEKERFLLGEKPDVMLPHNIYATDYEIVDLFDWQEEIKDMVSMHQLALELYEDDTTVRNWI